MKVYYPEYVPMNTRHFEDMLNQFRKAPTQGDLGAMVVLWVLSPDVDRQDIVVAQGRVEREKGWC